MNNIKKVEGKCNPLYVDLILLLFIIAVFISYNYEANLAQMSLIVLLLLGVLWWCSKLLFFLFPILTKYVLYIIIFIGLVEAVWGLGQLYNFFPSNHAIFKTTGSFFNSGPYGGFIALMFPLVLCNWIRYRKSNKTLEYIFIALGVIFLLIFPATLSRTAWIAAFIGCLLVLLLNTNVILKLRGFRKQYTRKFILITSIIFCLFIGGIYGIFHLKTDSANGRLFIWKITLLAIKEAPVQGVGLGGFPAAYANAQMDYFRSDNASETERFIAGSPEYAFNEYLKIFLEQGVIGGVLFLTLTILIIYYGIKNRQIGAAGSFLTLSIFAFASYPFYLWEFLVSWILLGGICVSRKKNNLTLMSTSNQKRRLYILFAMLFCILISASLVMLKKIEPYYKANMEWDRLKPFYTMKAHQNIVKSYDSLYVLLNDNAKFVFEYGVALNATKEHLKADSVLCRGLELSCDPMFYNVKGRNYHEMGEFLKAEECYLNSTYLLPERIYPYYLLTKLYADSAYYQLEKMKQVAHTVLEKEPKVHSMAIDEMRNEVRKILKEKEAEIK